MGLAMKKLFLIIISITLSLFYGEFLVRTSGVHPIQYTWQWAVTGFFDLHSDRIYTLGKNQQARENEFENTDASGFRYDPLDKNMMAKTTIFMFGDSFVYGHVMNDDETFPYVAQQTLLQKSIDVDIINAGIPGYGFDQTYLYVREVMEKYDPDIIVWNIQSNDIGDANDACLFAPVQGSFVRLPTWLQTLYLQGYVVRKSPQFIRDSYLVNLILRTLQNGHDRFTIGCTLPYEKEKEVTERGTNKMRYLLDKVEMEARNKGIRMIYTLLPAEYYFNTKEYPNDQQDMVNYFRIRAVLRERNRAFFDLNTLLAEKMFLGVLASRNESKIVFDQSPTSDTGVLGAMQEDYVSLFLPDEPEINFRHLNKWGNALLGELFADELIRIDSN